MIDCYSRRLVGWSIAEHMRTELVADALRAADSQRGSLRGAVFHSDHEAQDGAKDHAELCPRLGVKRSMGAASTSADNAVAESFNAALKRETLQGADRWDTAAQARLAVFNWITRYNTRRRHSYCGQQSPSTYEKPVRPLRCAPPSNHQIACPRSRPVGTCSRHTASGRLSVKNRQRWSLPRRSKLRGRIEVRLHAIMATQVGKLFRPPPLVLVIVCLLAGLALSGYAVSSSRFTDLRVYTLGGNAVLHNLPLYGQVLSDAPLSFTYTPFAAMIFAPLGLVGVRLASTFWLVGSLAALTRVCWLLAVSEIAVLSAWTRRQKCLMYFGLSLTLEPVTESLRLGQVNLFIILLVVEDVLSSRSRTRGLGTAIAAGIKLTPSIFIGFFVVAGQRRQAMLATVALFVTVLIGFLVQPHSAEAYWTGLAFDPKRVGGVAFVSNQSINGVLWRLEGPGGDRVLWLILSVAVLGWSMLVARRLWSQLEPLWAVSVIALAGLLASPISWSHHWVWVIVVLVAIGRDIGRRRGAFPLLLATYILLTSRIIWRVPNSRGREFHLTIAQMVASDAYVLLAMGLIAYASVIAFSPRAVAPSRSGALPSRFALSKVDRP